MNAPEQRSLRARVADAVTDIVMVGGAASVTAGTAMIYAPAGFIVAGLFLLGGSWIAARPE